MPYPNLRVEITDGIASAPARTRATPAFLFLLLMLMVWSDPLFLRRSFAGRDLLAYNLPMEKGIHDAYARGELPLWSPEISGGRPLLPNPNAGALYPVRMLLAPVRFPLAIKIFTVFHWAAAGLGMMVLLGAAGTSAGARWIGAVTYAFSGVVVSDVFFPHILPGTALLPWVVWAAARKGPLPSRLLLLSFLLALDMLAGDVFTVTMAILCAVAWIFCEEEPSRRRGLLTTLGGAVGLAALAALPQIAATVLWIPETNRAVRGINLHEALLFSLSPYRLLELVTPFPFGSVWMIEFSSIWGFQVFSQKYMGLFLTLYCGTLAFVALIALWKSSARGARFARALIVGAGAIAVIPSFVPESWRNAASPLPLRNPEKFAVVLVLGLAVLAGLAFDELRRRPRLPGWIFAATVPLAALAVAASAFPHAAARIALALTRTPDEFLDIAVRELPMALVETAFLWALTWLALELARARSRAGLLSGLLLLTAVPVLANRRIPWIFSEAEVFAPPAFVRYLWKNDPEGRYRTLGESLYKTAGDVEIKEVVGTDPAYTEFTRRIWVQHTHALWGRGTVFNGDFDNGDLSRIQSIRFLSSVPAGFKDGGVFFESLGLRYGTRFRDQTPLPGYARVGGNRIDDWDENPRALPDIRLVTGWVERPGAVEALHEMSNLGHGDIVLETGRSASGRALGGTVRILEESPSRLLLETEAAAPTWLFVLRGFWRHRTVEVDGTEVDVAPAQLAFSAIPVPAGKHRVEWREHFPGWSVSRVGPILSVLILALVFVRHRASGSRA